MKRKNILQIIIALICCVLIITPLNSYADFADYTEDYDYGDNWDDDYYYDNDYDNGGYSSGSSDFTEAEELMAFLLSIMLTGSILAI